MKNKLTKFLDENSYNYNTWENVDETIITIKVSKNDTDKTDLLILDKANSTARYDNIKDLRAATKMTQQAFGDYFGIPFRTIQDWEYNIRNCKSYIINLLDYKLRSDGVIK